MKAVMPTFAAARLMQNEHAIRRFHKWVLAEMEKTT
jgi:hypothetical protein